MAILIPNEKMPTNCTKCPCYNEYVHLCNVVDEDDYNGKEILVKDLGKRQDWCPLIDVLVEPDCTKVIIKTPMPKFMKGAEEEDDDS